MTIIVASAAAPIHSVIVFSCFVSGVCSLAVRRQQAGDPADLGVGTPRRHDHGATAVRDRRVHERHVRLVAGPHLRVGERVRHLRRRCALAGERGLVDVERARLDDPTVGGNVVAGGDHHDVAEDDLLCRDRRLDPAPAHPRGLLRQRLEGVHRALGLALLSEADRRR